MSSQLSLQIYLKKYSSISNSFIDDFFGLFDTIDAGEFLHDDWEIENN